MVPITVGVGLGAGCFVCFLMFFNYFLFFVSENSGQDRFPQWVFTKKQKSKHVDFVFVLFLSFPSLTNGTVGVGL